ncbi:MAG: virulence RhuM family protein [Planctomycetes bacterium]|nr:virulence RhuM family protein [Planctomycetota bacterium]
MTDCFLIYQSDDSRTKLDVRLEEQTVWLSQKQFTELFCKAKGTISEHITHIFEDKELEGTAVVRLFRTTAADGKQYEVVHYNLDMILELGFRVRSPSLCLLFILTMPQKTKTTHNPLDYRWF